MASPDPTAPGPRPPGNSAVGGPIPALPGVPLLPADASCPDGTTLYKHPVTGAPLPEPVRIVNGKPETRKARPVDAALAILDSVLPPTLDPALSRAAMRDTRAAVSATTPWDATELDPAVLARFRGIISGLPDPAQDEAAWRRAVAQAWPRALGLPLTVQEMIERARSVGRTLGMKKAAVAEGCRVLRCRPLKPDDCGAVAEWCADLGAVQSPEDWTRFVTTAWGRSRAESVHAEGVAARRSCGRTRSGPGGGVVRRCHTHGHAHADCGPRQAHVAREHAWPHAWAWQLGGVPLVRLGLTLPRMPGWSSIEALDEFDGRVAALVHDIAGALGCRFAARIGVERQQDDFPEWSVVVVDVDGTLQGRMMVEAAAYQAAQQHDPPPMDPGMLAHSAVGGSKWAMTEMFWPLLHAEVEAVARAAGFGRVYLAPVTDLRGTWADLHKSSPQSAGHEWPAGFKRWRSTRGSEDGKVLAFSAQWEAMGGKKIPKVEWAAQRRADIGARKDAEDPSVSRGAEAAADVAEQELAAVESTAAAAQEVAQRAAERAAAKRREAVTAWAVVRTAERDAVAAGRTLREAERDALRVQRRKAKALTRIDAAPPPRPDPAVKAARAKASAAARAADQLAAKVEKARAHVSALCRPSAVAAAQARLADLGAAVVRARVEADAARAVAEEARREFKQSHADTKAAKMARVEGQADSPLRTALGARLLLALRTRFAALSAAEAETADAAATRAQTIAERRDFAAFIESDWLGPLRRRARRLRQIAADRPNPVEVARRRAESLALLDGPLMPGERPAPAWWAVSARPAVRCDCEGECSCDAEALKPRSWTLTDELRWLRQSAPWLVIHGEVGCDGEIRRYAIRGGIPRNDTERLAAAKNDAARRALGEDVDALLSPPATVAAPVVPATPAANSPFVTRSPTGSWIITIPAGTVLREDPARRLAAVEARLRRDRRLPSDRPLGLPRDLQPHADPSWGPLPAVLDDAAINEVLRRYAEAGTRRAMTAPRAVDSMSLPVANESSWRSAAQALLESA